MVIIMQDHIVILHFPGSDWGSDLVCFHLPKKTSASQLMSEMELQRADMNSSDYDTLQDMADDLCTEVASCLGGTWEYVSQAGVFEIKQEP